MVTGDIIDLFPPGDPVHKLFDHLHVAFGPISFAELPDIDDVAVEYNCFRVDTFKVVQEFFCIAAIGAKVYIGKNEEIDLPFFLLLGAGFRG